MNASLIRQGCRWQPCRLKIWQMEDNWKPDFESLLLKELSNRAQQILDNSTAVFSKEVKSKKAALGDLEFLEFLELEPMQIKQAPIWEHFCVLKSKYQISKRIAQKEINERISLLQMPPTDVTELVAAVEQSPDYVTFLEGLKQQEKLKVLRNAHPVKKMKTYDPDPFGECLLLAIEDEAKLFLGKTSSIIEFEKNLAGILDAQAQSRFKEYFEDVDVKFERVNWEPERLAFLEEERNTIQKSPAIAFFDKQLHYIKEPLQLIEKVAIAIGMKIDPTPELLAIWQDCEKKPSALIHRIPYLEQLFEGLIEAKKFEFVEEELEAWKAKVKDSAGLEMPSSSQQTNEEALENATHVASPGIPVLQGAKLRPKALDYLLILNGLNIYGRKIMPDTDFQRLKSYVETMIEHGALPTTLEPFSEVRFPNGHIRYLFRCIHAEQYGRRIIQNHFIDFIHAVFPKFTGKKETTKRKFGEPPTTWILDLEKMKGG